MIFLGITEEEQSKKQKILATLEYEVDTSDAEETDNLEDSVNYFEIHKFIQSFPEENKYQLLEKFHADLIEGLDETFDHIEEIALLLEKFPFAEGSVIVGEI